MSRLGWLLLLLLALPVLAGIYRSIGPGGQVIYSDQSAPGAEKVDVDPTTYTPRALPQKPSPDQGEPTQSASEIEGYESFSIARPSDAETIWSNQGNVSIALSIEPTLKPGDKFQLLLDDHTVVAQGHSTAVQLHNIDRGTHRLQAVILNDSGREVARTTTTTFHMRRTITKRPIPRSSSP